MFTIRNYRPTDIEAVVALINADAAAFNRPEWGVTVGEMQEEMARPGFDPARDAFLVEAEGQLVGYAHMWLAQDVAESAFRFWAVFHPTRREPSIEDALMERLQARAQQRLSEVTSPLVYFGSGCQDIDDAQRALFERLAMRAARYFFEMVYEPLNELPAPKFPTGITVRTYVKGEDDERCLAAINEAFNDHWGHIPPTLEQWQHHVNSSKFRPDLTFLAFGGDEVAGVCQSIIMQDEFARSGRREGVVETLGVRRPYRRRGLGQALLVAGLRALKEAGMEAARLGVDADSLTGATRLYERVGFRVRKRFVLYRKAVRTEAPLLSRVAAGVQIG